MLQMRHARQCNATVRSVDGESMQATIFGAWESGGKTCRPGLRRNLQCCDAA
jgi:hypothetical protein